MIITSFLAKIHASAAVSSTLGHGNAKIKAKQNYHSRARITVV